MAVTMKSDGMKEISELLARMEETAPKAAAQGLYKGAGIVADEVKKTVGQIKTEPFRYAVFGTRKPSPEEKDAIESAGAGIAKFEKNGSEIQTSVGYGQAGYAEIKGKQVPIAKIANSVNSGTSFMQKQPFIRRAASSAAPKAMQAIRETIEAELDALNK